MAQPTYSSAVGYISEQFFTMSFDVALDAANPPPTNAFVVQINGTGTSVTGVTVDSVAKTVTLAFSASALTAGDIIEFSYSDPTGGNDANAIQGTDGADSVTFSSSTIVFGGRPGPAAPPTPALSSGSDSGTLGDGITSNTTPTVTGTAAANNTVKLYDTDGTTLLGTTTADGSGNWSITSSTLSVGAHTLKATQTDGGNITSPMSTGLALTIDTAAAAPTSLAMSSGSDSGTLGDGITNAGAPIITGHAEANATVRLYDTNGTTLLGLTTADGSGNFSITSSSLTEGAHTLTAKQTDAAGNVSGASTGFAYMRDTIGPTGMALSTTNVAMSSATNGATVATLSATDATAVQYGFAVGNGTIDADNAKFTISGTGLVAAQNLAAGTYHIYLKATDAAGNDSFQIFAIDVVDAPSVSSIVRAGAASATVPGAATSVVYTVTFSATVTGVDASDFTVTGTDSAVGTIGSVTGSGDTYTVTVNTLAGDGTLRLDLNSGGTGIQNVSAVGIIGGYTLGQTFTLDHTAPATPATVTFLSDTGASNTDLVTSTAAQTLSGTLGAVLGAGETVQVSLNNGGTWTPATATVGQSTWSLAGQTLAGNDTVKVRVSDAAGNNSTELSRNYVLDVGAPTANTAGGTPSDNSTSAATGAAIVLPFNEPLDPTGSMLTTVELRDVNTDTVVPATVTINGSGQLVITPTAALADSKAYYVNWGAGALKDLAGNAVAAVADETTYNFTTATPDTGGGPSQTVDGTTVQTGTTTNPDGSSTTTTTVTPVPSNRPEDPNTPNTQLADIPLASAGGTTVLQIGLPAGIGVASSETTGNNLSLRDKLIGASQPISLPADFNQLLQAGIDTFVPGVQDPSQVTVRTLTLTVGAGVTTAPGQPIVITGANGTGEGDSAHPQRQEALVIDARQLPPGTVLSFDKVEFAIVIGAVRVVGGEGANFVVGDGAAQFIVLGAEDDVLRGGGGNDVVGSKGGNDTLYGDEGNDTLVGGIGNDRLEGGAGNDILVGSASDAGTWRFALGADHMLHASYGAKDAALSELTQASITGNWEGGVAIDPRLAMVYNDYGRLETTALLFQGLTGQLPTMAAMNALAGPEWSQQALLQGAWNWFEGTLPAGTSTADKAKALITQTVGAPLATAQNLQIAVDFLGQGGTWTQALDFLVHLPQVKGAITTQTSAGAQLNLVQASTIAETGWSAGSGNDTLLGGAGNDVMIGGGGSDALDGGEGTDMAVYFGVLQHYSFKVQTGANGQQEVLVRHIPSGDEDTLRSVELLQVGGQAYRFKPETLQPGTEYQLAGHVLEVGTAELTLMGVPQL